MGVVVVGPDVGLAVVRVCSCWRVVGVVVVGLDVGLDVGLAVVGELWELYSLGWTWD